MKRDREEKKINMITEKTKTEMERLEMALRSKISEIGPVKAAEVTGILYNDISQWMSRKRNWSYNKILKISEMLKI